MNSSFRLNHAGLFSFLLGLAAAIGLGLALSFSATPVLGQAATGTLTGQVTDQQGALIANAEIKVVDPTTSSTRTGATNDVGRFTVPNVPPGTYDVTVSKTGFTSSKLRAMAEAFLTFCLKKHAR